MTADEHLLTGMVEAWAASVRARDIEGVLRNHGSGLLIFDVVGPMQLHGLDAYKATWLEQFFPWHRGTGRFQLKELKVHAGDTVAFATAILDCAGKEHEKPVSFMLRHTIGFQKRDGEWMIVNEHHSEPLK